MPPLALPLIPSLFSLPSPRTPEPPLVLLSHDRFYALRMASNVNMSKLDDSASDVNSSVDSRGARRRRRNNQNKQLAKSTLSSPPVIQRVAETKPVRLQLGLNLDVELELKARLQGDVSLTLLVEKKETPRPSEEIKPDNSGVAEKAEMFYMRLGTLHLRQRWIDREVSPSLTATIAFAIAAGGFVLGFLTSRCLDSIMIGYVRI
ncbi:hypothetical protein GQ53DRAFT_773507 [Thozetella sp. PMI_491]|nr:hypothetical protein GQ53DRAFT_773507 [Thozetella sp. PMI_491]